MVKYHYKKPVQLLPSLKDVLRIETVYRKKRIKEQLDYSEGNIDLDCQQTETETTQSDESQTCDISDIGFVWHISLSTILIRMFFFHRDVKSSPSSNHSNKSCGVKVENSNNFETPTSSPTCINITNNTFFTNNIVNVNVKCGSSDKCNGQTDLSCGYFENDLLKKEETVVKDIMDGCFNNDGKCS